MKLTLIELFNGQQKYVTEDQLITLEKVRDRGDIKFRKVKIANNIHA